MEIKNFKMDTPVKDIFDSMLLDSGTDICSAELSGVVKIKATVEVRGDVSVDYKGINYNSPSEFPAELKELIKKYPNKWDVEDIDNIYIGSNNWFEIFLWDSEGQFIESDVCDIEGNSEEDLKELILDYAQEWEDDLILSDDPIALAYRAMDEGTHVVTYYRRGDVTNLGAPEVRIVIPKSGCINDRLEELLHNAKEEGWSDEDILREYLMEPMPDDCKDISVDEYEEYLSIDLGYVIKGFSISSSEGMQITRMKNILVYTNLLAEKAPCYVRNFGAVGPDKGKVQKYFIQRIVRRSTDPDKYDKSMSEYEHGFSETSDIGCEVETNDDTFYLFLSKEV